MDPAPGQTPALPAAWRGLWSTGVSVSFMAAQTSGLMGHIARAVLNHGGEVTGMIPDFLVEHEVAFKDLPDLRVVRSMHERKALVAELSDAFIALPGGLGTIEEFFEVLTWAQLGRHEKPCGVLNVRRYFNPLLEFIDHAVAQRFVKPEHRSMMLVDDDPIRLLEMFEHYQPPSIGKWIDRGHDTVTGRFQNER